jgi:TrpR-related protein YerC/YecD
MAMPNLKKSVTSAFTKTESFTPRNEREKMLIEAILSLKTKEEAGNFLRDLLSLPEIEEFANRVTIVKRLLENNSYQEIATEFGTSTTTVTRVAHWLFSGCGGYYKVIKRLLKK